MPALNCSMPAINIWDSRGSIVAGRVDVPEQTLIMDGTTPVVGFTSRKNDLTHLKILFNLAQRDIAEDLIVSFFLSIASGRKTKIRVHFAGKVKHVYRENIPVPSAKLTREFCLMQNEVV